ncbi:F0F1 ATP synthase subunit gamma, partial [Bosea sp. (in: a-proteobacteria)]|uniref:F0F1 ATP synthase subunit gamma n=1 Tax=Bosea sp. (in: a-proteobacteria) TaxID=1871050 RepID=UPI003342E270
QFASEIIEFIDLREFKQVGFANAEAIAQNLLTRFANGEFDVATLFFSKFRSVIAQIPTAQRIIPAEIPDGTKQTDAVYDYEPEEGEILEALLPRNLTVQILRGLLENAASEQGARMSAMDSATRNAGEMIKKQTTLYNRSRQAMITKELIEIISGAEAL